MTEINDIRNLSNEEIRNQFNQLDISGFDGEFGCIQGLYQSVEFSPLGLGLLSGGLSGVVFVGLTSDGQRVEAYSLGASISVSASILRTGDIGNGAFVSNSDDPRIFGGFSAGVGYEFLSAEGSLGSGLIESTK